jgi:hypothetical protein
MAVATDQKLTGANSLKYSIPSSAYAAYVYKTIASASSVYVRFALRINSVGSGNEIPICSLDSFAILYLNGTAGTINFNAGSMGYIGSNFTYALNTWYQIELFYIQNSTVGWRVWNGAGNTLLAGPYTGSAQNNSPVTEIDLGPMDGQQVTMWVDAFVADNAQYPGPIVTSFYPFPSFHPSY